MYPKPSCTIQCLKVPNGSLGYFKVKLVDHPHFFLDPNLGHLYTRDLERLEKKKASHWHGEIQGNVALPQEALT